MAKNVITKEMAVNDFKSFMEQLEVEQDVVDKFVSSDDMQEQIFKYFESGKLRKDESGNLIQQVSRGKELKFRPVPPTGRDLNAIKPPNYDKMDDDTKQLIGVSWLTGETVKELLENYLNKDLVFARMLTNFL